MRTFNLPSFSLCELNYATTRGEKPHILINNNNNKKQKQKERKKKYKEMQLAGIHCFCRMFIWRSLLKLPENHAAYSSLVDKGTHTAFARLHEEYPIKSRKLLRVLQRFVLTSNDLHMPYTL